VLQTVFEGGPAVVEQSCGELFRIAEVTFEKGRANEPAERRGAGVCACGELFQGFAGLIAYGCICGPELKNCEVEFVQFVIRLEFRGSGEAGFRLWQLLLS